MKFLIVAIPAAMIALGQWVWWGKNLFNLHTLLLFIGFAVGFATAYSAVLWPPKKKARPR